MKGIVFYCKWQKAEVISKPLNPLRQALIPLSVVLGHRPTAAETVRSRIWGLFASHQLFLLPDYTAY